MLLLVTKSPCCYLNIYYSSFILNYSRNNSRVASAIKIPKIITGCNSHTLIAGDFNFPHVAGLEPLVFTRVGYSRNTFLETLDDLFLYQHMFTPTRQCQGQVPSTLDLVLSDDGHSVSKLVVTDSSGKLITLWLNLNIYAML